MAMLTMLVGSRGGGGLSCRTVDGALPLGGAAVWGSWRANSSPAKMSRPQLIHQISSSACILNRSWGYNPGSGYVWVSQGCAGTFADVSGYHHGRGDTYDSGARHYDDRGRDAGAVIGGLVLGAILEGAASGGHRHNPSSDGGDRRPVRCSPVLQGPRR